MASKHEHQRVCEVEGAPGWFHISPVANPTARLIHRHYRRFAFGSTSSSRPREKGYGAGAVTTAVHS